MPIRTVEELNQWRTGLPALLGLEVVHAEAGLLRARMTIRPDMLAANGYLHAASVVALADSACGFGTVVDLPEAAKGFTTIELKSNFLSTALEGTLECEAQRRHFGRSTQVWDAEVRLDTTLALFRCTQIILY
ncbi:MAG TPA: PaaI family thioesterase [Bryobacteraceae bacterium]|nr:PaaI family thioesterase [Bryobacteraceae bacterium]